MKHTRATPNPNKSTATPIGSRFDRLTVADGPFNRTGVPGYFYLCTCVCGKEKYLRGASLREGAVKSCGCLAVDLGKKRQTNLSHGFSKSATYRSWNHMMMRCKDHPGYAGRGIKVCERWRRFENFLADMGVRPANTTLGRRENDGDYCKDNCRWETNAQQARNKRGNVILEFAGRKQTLTDWATEKGLHRNTLSFRIRMGWPMELALGSSSSRSNRVKRLKPAA